MAETRIPSIPAVPTSADTPVRQFLSAVKEAIEVREGRRGDPLDSSVTMRRLKSMGALTIDQFGNPIFTGGGNVTVTTPGGGGGSGGYTPDLTPPPMPSGLTATAGFASIFIEWDSPAYTQGHGNAYTEIWAANRPAGGPDPTFGSAVFVGSTAGTGGLFSDSVPTLGVQRHYWIRHVTNDGVAGSYAGGTNGASAATGKVGGVDLAPLIIDASKLADGAVDFGGSKVTGTITDPARFGAAVIGSAAIQNLAVQNQHVGSLSADKITFGSMSGDRITVNTITADKFVVNLLQTDNVLTRGLTVRDASGNIILGAGNSLNWSNIAGQPSGIYNSNIYLNNGAIQGIGAGAGTQVDNAMVPIGANLVPNSDFSSPLLGSWEVLQDSGTLSNSGRDLLGWYPAGGHAIYWQNTSPTGACRAGLRAAGEWVRFAVVPGDWYELSAYVGSHRNVSYVRVGFYTDATLSTQVGTLDTTTTNSDTGGAGGGTTLAGYARLWGKGQVPTGASVAILWIQGGTRTSGADCYTFATQVFFGRCSANQTSATATPWAPAPARTPSQAGAVGWDNQITAGNASTYIANAAIGSAQVGTLVAGNIDTRGLTIKDASGNVIFGSGATVAPSSYMSVPGGWLNSNITVSGGAISGIGAGAGTVVDNSLVPYNQNLLAASDFPVAPSQSAAWNPDGAPIGFWGLSKDFPSGGTWNTSNYILAVGGINSFLIQQNAPWTGSTGGSGNSEIIIATEFGRAPCSAGQKLIASVYANSHRSDLYLILRFFDSNNNDIGGQESGVLAGIGGSLTCALSYFTRYALLATAPANTAYVTFGFRKLNTWSGQSSSYLFLACPMLEIGASGQTTPSPYVSGPARAISQYGYVGDLNATYGATIGSNLYGQITAANVSTYIASAAINLAQINVASIATLAALSATMGAVSIDGSGSSYHHIRTGSKWWNDGANGFIIAKAGTGETFMDFKAGNNRIWLSSWDDSGIAFVGSANFSVKSATSGARTEMGNRAIKIFDSAGTLRVRIGDLSA